MDTPLLSLNQFNLSKLSNGVLKHDYERSKLKAGIVHFGVGAFHRSHQAVYLDNVIQKTRSYEWAICGVGLLPYDLPMKEAMQAQDCLYTVTEMAPEGICSTSVVQCMVEYIYAPDDYDAVTVRLLDPDIKIVSLTITEGGYYIDNKGTFLIDSPAIVQDLANPSSPRSAIGYIVEALARRRNIGIPAFTVMSCDNLRHNGSQAKKACLSYARARDESLAAWIEENVAFPNGMVDRITPATDVSVKERIKNMTGIEDCAPVVAENFIQWVLEDNFKYGRPAYDLAGVMMTDDVTPYEEAKIRLLNGTHQMLSYPAFLAGKRKVDEALNDPVLFGYLRNYLFEAAGKYIPTIVGLDLDVYKETLLHRFSNAAVGDQLARLCLDGGSKIPGFLLPTLKANLEATGTCHSVAYLLACYNYYIRNNIDDNGVEYVLREPNAMATLEPIIASDVPHTLLQCSALVGDAVLYPQFVADYLKCHTHIQKFGVYKTLESLETILQQA
jgi:mannitol 2-dehydrogenase